MTWSPEACCAKAVGAARAAARRAGSSVRRSEREEGMGIAFGRGGTPEKVVPERPACKPTAKCVQADGENGAPPGRGRSAPHAEGDERGRGDQPQQPFDQEEQEPGHAEARQEPPKPSVRRRRRSRGRRGGLPGGGSRFHRIRAAEGGRGRVILTGQRRGFPPPPLFSRRAPCLHDPDGARRCLIPSWRTTPPC